MSLPDLIARLRFEFHDQGSGKAAAAVRSFESGAKSAGAATTGLEKSTTASHDRIVAAHGKSGASSERLAQTTEGSTTRSRDAYGRWAKTTESAHQSVGISATTHLGKASAAHDSFGKSATSTSNLTSAAAGKTSASFEKLAGTLAGRMGPASGVANTALSKVTSLLGGLPPVAMGAAAGVAALAAGFLLLASKGVTAFVSMTAEVRKFKAVTGSTAAEASLLTGYARRLGIDQDTLAKGMGKLDLAVAKNSAGLNKYGVDVAYTKKGNADMVETLLRVGDAWKQTTDPAQKAQLQAVAFSKTGQALVPLLGKTREELRGMAKDIAARGEMFPDEDLNSGKEFIAAMRLLQLTLTDLAMAAGRELVPRITEVVKAFVGLIDAANKLGVLKLMGYVLAQGLLPVKLGIEAITKVVEELGSVTGPIFDKIGSALSGIGHFLGITHDKSKDAAKGQKDLAESEKEVTSKALEEKAVLDKLVSTLMAAVSSSLSAEGAWNSFADALQGVTDAAKSGTATSKEQRDAMLSVRQAAVSAADAEVKLASDQAEANSTTLDGAAKAHIYREALVKAAAQASGPTRASIQSVIDRLDAMPGSKEVTVGAKTDQANQAVDGIKGKVEGLADKNIKVNADTSNAESSLSRVLGLLSNIPGAGVAVGIVGSILGRSSGGPVQRNRPYVVGEDGPELFVPDLSGVIVPSAATRRGGAPFGPAPAPAAASGGSGSSYHQEFHVYPPAGSDPATVAAMVGREQVWRSRR